MQGPRLTHDEQYDDPVNPNASPPRYGYQRRFLPMRNSKPHTNFSSGSGGFRMTRKSLSLLIRVFNVTPHLEQKKWFPFFLNSC